MLLIRRKRNLPWPCSRVARDVLHSLWLEAQRTKKPITAIIKSAVDQYLNFDAIDARIADEFTGFAA